MAKKPTPLPDAEPLLRVRSTIDAAEMARIYAGVRAMSVERLTVQHRARVARMLRHLPTSTPRHLAIAKWLCIGGLTVSIAMTGVGGLPFHGYPLELLFAAFFAVMLVLCLGLPKFTAWVEKCRERLFEYLALKTANRTLKAARKNLPFEAEYQFFGDEVAYSRIIGEQEQLIWKRRLQGTCLPGDGFTLLYKKPTSQEPYGILLHAPSPELNAQLDQLGLQV
ncbi:hypothetical protein ACXZ1M_01515 [Duganella sp. PWIR1]